MNAIYTESGEPHVLVIQKSTGEIEPSGAYFEFPNFDTVTPEVTRTESEGIDFGWVMQVTFITSIFVGTPVVAILAIPATLPTWAERAQFAVGIGAAVWFVVGLSVYTYARRNHRQDS